MSPISGRFTRIESRRRARQSVLGLLSDLPRKNCRTIAEWAGDRTTDGMQHLLGRAKWDADQVRDEVGERHCGRRVAAVVGTFAGAAVAADQWVVLT